MSLKKQTNRSQSIQLFIANKAYCATSDSKRARNEPYRSRNELYRSQFELYRAESHLYRSKRINLNHATVYHVSGFVQ